MMDVQPNEATDNQQHQRHFVEYLLRQNISDPTKYVIDLDSLRSQLPSVAQDITKRPTNYYKLMKEQLEKMAGNQTNKSIESKIEHWNIGFDGNLGSNFVTPRGLGSKFANQLVGVQGIITKMDLVRSQLEKSVHWCSKTKSFETKEYPDGFAPQKEFEINKNRFIKKYDDNNNPLQFEYGQSSFRDIQTVVIQELPQMAPPGLLPMSVTVVLQSDLVNSVKPGDRVQMIGIYKLIAGFASKQKGIFRPYFLCLNVRPLHQVPLLSKLTIKTPFAENEIFSLFSRSIAPSIYGHQQLKKAVLLMLLGGSQTVLENGTHLRGDINLLMVGDPGTAKSQILRWVLSTVDLGIGTTGSGASGVGLTAAVVTDRQTGERTLEAGAMVLADRGVVCIDQFDKMNQVDRVAVHQVMEQQTVTIAKAGIHCSLNARCAVIAAANPIYGQYQKQLPPTRNIGMPDSLLSRFDLIFIILDQKSSEKDKKVSERVCRNHRLAPNVAELLNQYHQQDDYIIQPTQTLKLDENTFDKSNIFKSDHKAEILTQGFLKKYINHCKKNIAPILSDNSISLLAQLWTLLRQKDFNDQKQSSTKVLPITIRSYETLIRLSTAHAKLRQSSIVDVTDCLEAFRLMVHCLYGSEEALDQQLDDILRSLNLEVRQKTKMELQKKSVKKSQTTVKNEKKDEIGILSKQMKKLQIDEKQKETNKVIEKIAKAKDIRKEQKTAVWKALVSLNKKKKQDYIKLQDLIELMSKEGIDEFDVHRILLVLAEEDEKLHYEEKERKIHL